MASALEWGSRGREFKPHRSDQVLGVARVFPTRTLTRKWREQNDAGTAKKQTHPKTFYTGVF